MPIPQEEAHWLEESGRQFRALAEHLPVGVFMNDASGGCVYVNSCCCLMLEASAEELAGDGWFNLLHPEDRERTLRQWSAAREAGTDFRAEFRFLPRSGIPVWVEAHVKPLRASDGGVLGFIGTITDQTKRVAANAEAARAAEHLHAVIDASPLAILSLDAAGRVMGWSRGAERMFGWREEEVLGRACPTVPDEVAADFHEMVGAVLAGARLQGEVRVHRRKSGEAIRVRISARVLEAGDLEGAQLVVVLDDITDRERAAGLLQRLLDERERLAADLHDGGIQSLLAISLALERSARLAEGGPALHAQVRQSARELLEVIDELRALFLEGAPSAQRGEWNIEAAVLRMILLHGAALPSCSVDFDADAARRVSGEQALQLVQIAREAISNAARHSSARNVRLRLQRQGDFARFEVEDDGIGITPGAPKGHGLRNMELRALSVGGHAMVLPRDGGGTRIVVDIPVGPPQRPANEPAP